MLKRPLPITELFAEGYHNSRVISLTVGSTDAESWVEQEGPLFGMLSQLNGPCFHLRVFETYDFEEVLAYFKSYNDKDE